MNDPIKDFVEQHREEFDHLEAPVLKLDQLKAKFQRVPEVRKRNFLTLKGNRWLVAAAMLMTLTCAWLFFYRSDKEKPSVQLAPQQTNNAADKVAKHIDSGRTANNAVPKRMSAGKPLGAGRIHKAERKAHKASIPAPDLYAGLKDSTSASTRLLAILEIEKSGRIDNHLLDMLAATLNNDQNTNVRLAALSLMEKYSYDGHVSSLLVSSLNQQDDPIVQLGLVSLLGKMKNIKIDDKLHSLASGPDTFAAVRDEAYNILLEQNKL